MTLEEVIRLLTTSFRYPTLLIPAIFLIVLWKEAFNLGSVKNKSNSEEGRDGKKTQNQWNER